MPADEGVGASEDVETGSAGNERGDGELTLWLSGRGGSLLPPPGVLGDAGDFQIVSPE